MGSRYIVTIPLTKRTEFLFFAAVLLYLLLIVLLRGPYNAEQSLSPAALISFTAVPVLAGAMTRNKLWLALGVLVAAMVPFQKSIAVTFILGVVLLFPVVMLSARRRSFIDAPPVRMFALFSLYLLFPVLLHAGSGTDIWSFPLLAATMLAVPLFWLLLFYGLPWLPAELRSFGRLVALLLAAQFLVVALYPLLIGKPQLYQAAPNGLLKGIQQVIHLPLSLPYGNPDWNRGSFVDAHQAGLLLAIAAALPCFMAFYTRRISLALAGLLLLYLFGMTETAHATAGLAVAVLISIGAVAASKATSRIPGIAVFSVVLLAPFALAYYVYAAGPAWMTETKKAIYYRAASTKIAGDPVALLFGHGPAAFGSRAGNKRLPEQYHALEYAFPQFVPRSVHPAYADVLEQAQRGKMGSTAEIHVSGLVALVGEGGLTGSLLFSFFLWTLYRDKLRAMQQPSPPATRALAATAIFAMSFMACALVFRQYLEYPQVMGFVWLVMLAPVKTKITGYDLHGSDTNQI